jgi:hypothetical protein
MTQRVNLPSNVFPVLFPQPLPSGDPGKGTGDGAGDGAGGSFSREDSVSIGVNGRVETTCGVAGRGTCVSITSQAGGLGPAPVEPEAAGKPPHNACSAPRYPADVAASRGLSGRRAGPSQGWVLDAIAVVVETPP